MQNISYLIHPPRIVARCARGSHTHGRIDFCDVSEMSCGCLCSSC